MLCAVTYVAGFVTISQSYRGSHPSQLAANQRGVNVSNAQQSLGFLWHSPAASNESRGLGMGITWAWDGALCPKLLPRFKEDFFFVEARGESGAWGNLRL